MRLRTDSPDQEQELEKKTKRFYVVGFGSNSPITYLTSIEAIYLPGTTERRKEKKVVIVAVLTEGSVVGRAGTNSHVNDNKKEVILFPFYPMGLISPSVASNARDNLKKLKILTNFGETERVR
jgi:hypothetical protein